MLPQALEAFRPGYRQKILVGGTTFEIEGSFDGHGV
jgi:hypothetical protein